MGQVGYPQRRAP